MSTSTPHSEPSLPPSRFILDLDQPLQLQALLDSLELLAHPPLALEKPGPERQWRGQLLLRLSYLLSHCSLTRAGSNSADLQVLAKQHETLARRLLLQPELLRLHSRV